MFPKSVLKSVQKVSLLVFITASPKIVPRSVPKSDPKNHSKKCPQNTHKRVPKKSIKPALKILQSSKKLSTNYILNSSANFFKSSFLKLQGKSDLFTTS